MNNLKLYILHRGYSQTKLAERIGVSKSLISKWIKEEEECPLRRKLQIARLFQVDSRLIFPEKSREKGSFKKITHSDAHAARGGAEI